MTLFKIRLLFLFVLFTSLIKAQDTKHIAGDSLYIKKGNKVMGISINGFVTGENLFEYYGIRYGQFIKNKLIAGAELGRSWFDEWERTTHFGLYSRYNFAEYNRFLYYVNIRYLFGIRNYYNEITLSEWNGITNNVALNLGIAFKGFYQKRFSLEFFCGYAFNSLYIKNHPVLKKYTWSKSDIIYGFQLNYSFKTFKKQ